MATHNYTFTELEAGTAPVGISTWELYQRCLAHGYTNPIVTLGSGNSIDVTIDESDNKAVVLANLESAVIPTLSLDKSSVVVAGNGVATDTITVTDSRGAGATGKTLKLTVPPGAYLPVDADQLTLDGSGQATLNIGPCQGCVGEVLLNIYYDNGEADSATFTLRFGS